jgi:hypothetical protein
MINGEYHLFQYDYNFTNVVATPYDADKYDKIAKKQQLLYKYKQIKTSIGKYNIYRIPRTFTIAYNDTTLISVSMCANLYMLYWLLTNMGCRDIITHIVAHLFTHCQYDYSLYICVN